MRHQQLKEAGRISTIDENRMKGLDTTYQSVFIFGIQRLKQRSKYTILSHVTIPCSNVTVTTRSDPVKRSAGKVLNKLEIKIGLNLGD